jgi:hypothetical protein
MLKFCPPQPYILGIMIEIPPDMAGYLFISEGKCICVAPTVKVITQK